MTLPAVLARSPKGDAAIQGPPAPTLQRGDARHTNGGLGVTGGATPNPVIARSNPRVEEPGGTKTVCPCGGGAARPRCA